MFVKSLTIKNFRNHKYLSYDFSNKINVITGSNGSGKTNIVEAIYYLSLARSFRTQNNIDLINDGQETAIIIAEVLEGQIKREIRVVINKDCKKVYLNNKPINKLSELAKSINVILFEPKDVLMFKSSPKVRRNFLDISLSKKSDSYLDYISRYSKILKQRNELLKKTKIDENLLSVLTEMMIKLSKQIIRFRQLYVESINEVLDKIYFSLTGKKDDVKVVYYPFIDIDDEYQAKATELFEKSKESDIKKKATSIGIHREDFKVLMNNHDIATYGSQGENRIVTLALKLSPYFIIKDREKRPIVVLDDVMSELDENHKNKLIDFIRKLEQVFITATEIEVKDASIYKTKKKEDF